MKKLFIFLSLGFLLFFGIVNSAINVSAYTDNEYDVTINTMINASSLDKVVIKEQYGALITPFSSGAPENHKFAFWIINGVVRYDLDFDYEFLVNSNLEITGVFEPSDDSEHAVLFIDSNGKLIKTHYVPTGEDITTLPNIDGYTKPHYVVAETPWKEANKSPAVFTNITESKVFVLQYKLDGTVAPVIITVNGVDTEYAYNEIVTLNADSENFSHWEDDGVIVSYNPTYTFTAIADRTIEAKESGSSSTPLVTLQNVTGIREGYKSFLGQVYLPDGYTLIETGILASNEEKVLFLDSTDTEVIKSNSILETTNEFLRSFPEASFTTFRAYVVVKSGEEIEVIYSENNYYSVPSDTGENYTETFDSSTVTSSYGNGSFISQNIEWTYVHARNEDIYGINGKGILLSNEPSSLTFKGNLDKEISSFSFEYRKANTDTAERIYKVDVKDNGIVTTYDIPVFGTNDGADDTVYIFKLENLHLIGEIEIKIYATGKIDNQQMIVDNFNWLEIPQETSITKLYTVEFNSEDSSTTEFVRLGKYVQELTPPIKVGYTFIGWFDENDNEFDLDTKITKHIRLYAKYNINQYTLSFDTDGGSIVESITADFNTLIVPPSNPTKEGYTFSDWNQELPTHMPASNATYTAVWAPKQYTISFNTRGGSSVESITADYNTPIVPPSNPTKEGYTFSGWSPELPTHMPAFNATYNAVWTPNQYTISFDSNGGSSVEPIIATYPILVTPPHPTRDGYEFRGWFTDKTYTNEWNFNRPVIENITLYAKWITYVQIEISGNSEIRINDGPITYNGLIIHNSSDSTINVAYYKNTTQQTNIFSSTDSIILGSATRPTKAGGQLTISVDLGYISYIKINTNINFGLSINGGDTITDETITIDSINSKEVTIIHYGFQQTNISGIYLEYVAE